VKYAAILVPAGVAGWYLSKLDLTGKAKEGAKQVVDKAKAEPKKVFTGGDQGFVSLKLDAIENINHNTKKFRFSFEDPEAVSGLQIACRRDIIFIQRLQQH
jgi:cytochrome-b5 reductase